MSIKIKRGTGAYSGILRSLSQPGGQIIDYNKTGIRRAGRCMSYARPFLAHGRRRCTDSILTLPKLLSRTEEAWEIRQSPPAYTQFHRERENTNIMGGTLHGKAPDKGKEQSQSETICRNQSERAKPQ